MLSPTGLSRPFSADGDGYVRSEGAVVLILRKGDLATLEGNRLRGEIVDVAVNSDGRTSGISLPSLEGQRRLLDRFYDRVKVSPDEIAFVEAHGTGTKVGDPIEATAIGQAIGQRRSKPLPIGSVKSNIGHLEAASGLAGLLKSAMALEKGRLPRSLFLDKPNDAIDFAGLNLAPNAKERPLDRARDGEYAAICNYGFGGTNAHVLIKAVPQAAKAEDTPADVPVLLLSAATKDALSAMATGRSKHRGGGHSRPSHRARLWAISAKSRSCVLPFPRRIRLRLPLARLFRGAEYQPELRGGGSRGNPPARFRFFRATARNSARWAMRLSRQRRVPRGDRGNRCNLPAASGWSIGSRLEATIPSDHLEQTSVAQPLIYAIQSSLAAILMRRGFRPEGVLGHSVGESGGGGSRGHPHPGRCDAPHLSALEAPGEGARPWPHDGVCRRARRRWKRCSRPSAIPGWKSPQRTARPRPRCRARRTCSRASRSIAVSRASRPSRWISITRSILPPSPRSRRRWSRISRSSGRARAPAASFQL